jgi:predicted acetyltransferase
MEIRTARLEDIPTLATMACESFPSGYSYEERVQFYHQHPRRRFPQDVLVAEVNHQIVASLNLVPYHIWIGGARLPMVGVATVANRLEARRRGYASQLCSAAIQQGYQQGYVVSILYPFRYNFYRKLGWGAIGEAIEYNFSPRSLPSFSTDGVRRFQIADLFAIASCHQRFVEQGNCLAERTQPVWEQWQKDITAHKRIVMVYQPADKIHGYLSFRADADSHWLSQSLEIQEFVYTDATAYQALLGFLATLSDQFTNIRYRASRNEALHYLLTDPRDQLQPTLPATLGSRAGQLITSYMLRVLDVAAALQARPNYQGLDGQINFCILDPQLPENNQTFGWQLTAGKPQVVLGGIPQAPTLTLSIDLFSQLYTGAWRATQAAFGGLITLPQPELGQWLDRAFYLPAPALQDEF